MILKVLSALLTYPTEELLEALDEIAAIIDGEGRLSLEDKRALSALIEDLSVGDAVSTQERYVDLFDRGRKTALHLFEHVHGESRDRGQAMVDLRQVYAHAGYALRGNELPDYLPALLEFLSQRPPEDAREMLSDCAHIVRAIGEALRERGSHYAAVFAALLTIIGEPGLTAGKRDDEPAREEKTLDEEWAEEPVIFGPAAGASCASGKPQVSVVQFVPRRSR